MPEPLSIAVAQPHCRSYDVAANALTHAATVCRAAARVVVFPELSLTGYHLDAAAIRIDDERLAPLILACAESHAMALAGAPVSDDGGGAYIAVLAIDGGGARVAYRKKWLSADESRRFVPGAEPAAVDLDGWRLGLAVCKDTGIAAHQSSTAALGIDAYVAGTLMGLEETAEQEDRGRRIADTHGIFVAFASFADPTGEGYSRPAGRSAIWSPGGRLLAQAGPEPGELASALLVSP